MRSYSISGERFFDKACKVASFYGFAPADKILEHYKRTKRKKIPIHNQPEEKHLLHLSRLLQFYFERSLHLDKYTPLFLFHSNIDQNTRSAVTRSKKPDEIYFTLTVLGINDPYAEALLLACTSHIFRLFKSKNYRIRINSMGTNDDSKIFFSKLAKTLKKQQKNIHPECKKLLDAGRVCEAHTMLYNNDHHAEIAECIVPTLRLLSEKARQHFEQVIEYLEATRLPYELAPDVIELTKNSVHTAFEINDEDSPLYAHGARYDQLPQHLYRRRAPATSMTIILPEKTHGVYQPKKRQIKPKIFFFHAGEKARLQSLHILSKLYDANIPIAHQMHYTRVADQLHEGIRSYPYTIVFGQEELENNVICLRNTDTRASQIIDLDDKTPEMIKNFIKYH